MVVQIAAGRTLTEVDVDDFLTGRRAAQASITSQVPYNWALSL